MGIVDRVRPLAHGAGRGLRRVLLPLGLALCAAAPPSASADAPAGKRSGPSLLDAVVGVDTRTPGNARTADSLGTTRHGSGVLISHDGLVVTIGWLVMEASEITVETGDGRTIPASFVGYDHESGLGLVRTQVPPGAAPVALGTAAGLDKGTRALVADRRGVRGAQGVHVADRRPFAGAWEYLLEDAIFTSPPDPGFAGAALLGADGSLLGIGYLMVGDAAGGDAPEPGNMFVPIDALAPVLDEVVANGRRSAPAKPWLGLYPATLRGHVFVERVADGGPASRAGLGRGDLVVAVGDTEVHDLESYFRAVWDGRRAGDGVTLRILDATGTARSVTVRSMDRNDWLRLNPTL